MLRVSHLLLGLITAATALAQAAPGPAAATPPSPAEVRSSMGIPSHGDLRGQQDIVGFASTREQMARAWELSNGTRGLTVLSEAPSGDVLAVLCPHDDYLYAGRVYREVLPLLRAKTVVLVGVFHSYRRFGAHDLLVFDPYRAWRSPDGEIAVSALRDELLATLPPADFTKDAAMHDSEHSLEALAYWLKHIRPDVEILPVLVPACSFSRMEELAGHVASRLAALLGARGLQLGRHVAVAVSSDAVHYGADFKHVPYGDGGVEAYSRACERDRELLVGLAGPLTPATARRFFEACVNPDDPSQYRLTWCGRFSIPFGLLLLDGLARAGGLPGVVGTPLSYSTSVGQPELAVRKVGLGETAPANLYHFVGYPAAAFVAGSKPQ